MDQLPNTMDILPKIIWRETIREPVIFIQVTKKTKAAYKINNMQMTSVGGPQTRHVPRKSENTPDQLKKRYLHTNAGKREEYIVKKGGPEQWKICKYLGPLLDTECDIGRRKGLAYDAYNKLKSLISHKNASTSSKIRRCDAFVSTTFLHNHYSDVIMASRLFTQPLIQAQIKENIKAPRHWPLWGESTGGRWIPLTKGQ